VTAILEFARAALTFDIHELTSGQVQVAEIPRGRK
jgi:hypothetical protein